MDLAARFANCVIQLADGFLAEPGAGVRHSSFALRTGLAKIHAIKTFAGYESAIFDQYGTSLVKRDAIRCSPLDSLCHQAIASVYRDLRFQAHRNALQEQEL